MQLFYLNKQFIPKMKFDWHKDKLSLKTVIDKNYKNTQNVRRFFTSEIGDHFHFDREFMKWLKENQGKTLLDAVLHRKKMYERNPG